MKQIAACLWVLMLALALDLAFGLHLYETGGK